VLWQRLTWTVEHVCDAGFSQQQVLLARSHGRGYYCIFSDIFDRVPDLRRFVIGPASEAVYAEMKHAAESARVTPSGACVSHGTRSRPARCHVTQADVDVSGSPCNSWSSEGVRAQHDSPWVAATLAWCVWVRHALLRLAIHENVMGFDVELLREMLGDLYDIFTLTVRPCHAGFSGVRRNRLYAICVLRSELRVVHDISSLYEAVCAQVSNPCCLTVADISRATVQELLEEENTRRLHRKLPLLIVASGDWSYLLSDRQKGLVATLRPEWRIKHGRDADQDPECVWDLHLSAERSRCPRSRGVLPTLTNSNVRTLWLPSQKRWLMHRELAAAMGYPVYPELAQAAGVAEDVHTSPPGCRSKSLGGAMQVANVGCVMAVALAATAPH
jgi:site-specific DNA-cytosine methylase